MIQQISRNEFLMETHMRMEENFPFTIGFDILQNISGREILSHWHDALEIIYIEEGSLIFVGPDGEITLNKGQGVIINGNVLHAFHQNGRSDCTYLVLNFHPSLLGINSAGKIRDTYLKPYLWEDKRLQTVLFTDTEAWQQEFLHTLHHLLAIWQKHASSCELEIQANLLLLWRCIYENILKNSIISGMPDPKLQAVQNAVAYIHENFFQKIYICQLAQICNSSQSECWRLFRKYLGLSPTEYILHYRLKMSLSFLKDPTCSITLAALNSGFENHSYYTRAFRKLMNCTPRDYRKKLLESSSSQQLS